MTSLNVAPTGHRHEYLALLAPDAVTLNKANAYDLKVVFPQGDVSFDCVELKSRGK